MTDTDDRLDFGPLQDESRERSARVVAQVMERVSTAREMEAGQRELRQGVRRSLARWAMPAMIAAAASLALVLLLDHPQAAPIGSDPFAVVVMGRGPVTRWVALGDPPGIPELVAVMRARQ